MTDRIPPARDLRQACVQAAHAVIATQGLEALSLREVARRLGVSHQAPYKHFASRDHLLAEVIAHCFEGFAQALAARPRSADAGADLAALGEAYLAYAAEHPLEYHLMFATAWPEAASGGALKRDARLALQILQEALAALHGRSDPRDPQVELDALYVWATMHGLASILHSDMVDKLDLRRRVRSEALAHAFARLGAGLRAPIDSAAGPAPPRARRKATRRSAPPAPAPGR